MTKHLAVLALAGLALAACDSNRNPTEPGSAAPDLSLRSQLRHGVRGEAAQVGAVYTITNEAAGNAVAVFAREANGALTPAGTFPTGGTGTGSGLGSQGAITLSADGRWLVAVNAGSNDVSVFRVQPSTRTLTSRTPSGGTLPISVTISRDLVYVLNAGGAGNISGFALDGDGGLAPIAGSTRSLSGADVQPAQVSFDPAGHQLLVTEKATNLLDIFPVDEHGVAGERTSVASAGGTPFGFTFGPRNLLFVSEAAGAGSASSYRWAGGRASVLSGAVPTNQGAPCWTVVTLDGRFGYTGNGAGSVTGFAIAPNGTLRRLDDDGATALIQGGVNDIALNRDSRYLYVLQVGAAPAIHGYRIERNGRLVSLGSVSGLPAGTRGLVAR